MMRLLILLLALPFLAPAQMQMGMRGKGKPLYYPQQLDSLFYWFKADEGVFDSLGNVVTTDDVGIAEWRDFSGNNYHVTQTTNGSRPVYKTTGGPGSKPTIQFDGTDDFLASAAHLWESDDLTVFVVMKFGNATRNAAEFILSRESASNQGQFDFFGGISTTFRGVFRVFEDLARTKQQNKTTPNNWKHTDYKLHALNYNGAKTLTWHTNGASVAVTTDIDTSNGSIADHSQPLEIGSSFSGTSGLLLGSISEIIVYSRALTTVERLGVEQYLNAKYQLY